MNDVWRGYYLYCAERLINRFVQVTSFLPRVSVHIDSIGYYPGFGASRAVFDASSVIDSMKTHRPRDSRIRT